MDFGWSPLMCHECQQLGTCTNCIYVTDQDIDMKSLILYTKLPELWEVFNTILSISSFSENGLTMDGALAYLKDFDFSVLQVTHSSFWHIMRYFLSRVNAKFIAKQQLNRRRNNG